jgi:hypothetical protein
MTACQPTPAEARPDNQSRSEARRDSLPQPPDRRLWKTDSARAFEAGVQWFLAVSRAA